MQSVLLKLEADIRARKRPHALELRTLLRPTLLATMLFVVAFQLGARTASSSETWAASLSSDARLRSLAAKLEAREGELELQRTQIERLERIQRNSARYGIRADLAAAIDDIALAENVDPRIAFELVRVESRFNPRAVSPVGAVGLTQLMPATARHLKPGITRAQLFDPETNLRLGFRFYRYLLNYYGGDVRLALHAYNRGPATVDKLLKAGRDPSNGYARMVLGR